MIRCTKCNGTGICSEPPLTESVYYECSACRGTGRECLHCSGTDSSLETKYDDHSIKCPKCNGTGKVSS